jgi:phenylglyoxylate dehydrogenase alpha subunit
MRVDGKVTKNIKVCDGNRAAAYGVLASNPNVIAIYPITPQTSLIEYLTRFKADGLLKAEIVEVEGEISAMGVAVGTALAGGRTFTATSSMGLNFMYDTYGMAAQMRLPVVMVNANREQHPSAVASGQQDIMDVANSGWIHVHTESCQEILDSIIMAYKLAEDPHILLPVTVCYDGFYLSYLAEPVEIPPQAEVNRFIPRVSREHLGFDPLTGSASTMIPRELAECRYKHQMAMERAKSKIDEIDREFANVFGRYYGGLVEAYRMEDAEIALVSMGSHTGTCKTAIDRQREQGRNVGLVKIRVFRPFPWERVCSELSHVKAIGVIDRSICFGWNCGYLYHEVQTALCQAGLPPRLLDFICGLGGEDITMSYINQAIDSVEAASKGENYSSVTWLALES